MQPVHFRFRSLAASLCVLAATSAQATVITFDDLQPADVLTTYKAAGYSFAGNPRARTTDFPGSVSVQAPPYFASNDTACEGPYGPQFSACSAFLSLKRADGGAFDLLQLDAALGYMGFTFNIASPLRFIALSQDGSWKVFERMINKVEPTGAIRPMQQTIDFGTAFLAVYEVRFVTFATDVSMDNMVVSTAPAAVPEPASWGLLIAGFGLIGCAARQQRSNAGVQRRLDPLPSAGASA